MANFWFEKDCDINGETFTVFAEGTITKFSPATYYDKNGDPGMPVEGGDVTFTKTVVYNDKGTHVYDVVPDKDWMEEQAAEASR